MIPVQKNSKSRRQFKHRGNGASTSGRKPIDQEKQVQFSITDDTDDCVQYHTLPTQKHAKRRQKHSLKQAVEQNIPLAKKHFLYLFIAIIYFFNGIKHSFQLHCSSCSSMLVLATSKSFWLVGDLQAASICFFSC